MNNFFNQTSCDRCGGSLENGRTMSMYNTDCICMECKRKERMRNDYKLAVETDHEHIKNGDYNFKGIGF